TFAPNVVTVFLAACATKVSIYILLRFDFFVFQPNLEGHDFQFAYFLMPLSLLAILVASAVAMFEPNLKRLLAWSSVAQIGYITLGASLVSVPGITAGLLHIFNHALAKGALFLAVACLGISVARMRIDTIRGIAQKMPWTMAAFLLAGFSLIGVPGTAGFISKWYLITATLRSGSLGIALVAVIVISSLMAVVYIWRVVEAAYFKPLDPDSTAVEAPLPLLLATWGAVLLNFYFGLRPDLPVTLATSAAQMLHGQMQ
ncbi:MAG: monovalent cation/H+ antiporter subunit D family protein, partial [Gammaproteobacteria bacterium]|nr:monovalent cation/H+ antiporter subunit D family protein [Gammaproteobacteria bacterium]